MCGSLDYAKYTKKGRQRTNFPVIVLFNELMYSFKINSPQIVCELRVVEVRVVELRVVELRVVMKMWCIVV